MEPLVSIIIPVYNAGKYLDRCIQSVVNQTYKKIEVLLIDDGSKDNSAVLCDMYAAQDSRVIVYHEQNQGVFYARNKALDSLSGDFMIFVDADDCIAPNLVELALQTALHEQADIVLFQYERFTDKFNPILSTRAAIDYSLSIEEIQYRIMINKISNFIWSAFYRTSLWENVRFPALTAFEDLFICPQIFCQAHKIVSLDNILYYYNRGNQGSITYGKKDFDSQHRYAKYKAYEEHFRIAKKMNQDKCIAWAAQHMIKDAVKLYYINFFSKNKLTVRQKNEILNCMECNWDEKVARNSNFKTIFFRWSALQCPIFCWIYGAIKYLANNLSIRR